MNIKYIKEIDGLRAVAVMAVVLYHVRLSLLGGGFIGVDVFFVISGYLISKIILADIEANTFSLANFYVRRILRIAPALAATLLLTSLLFFLLYPPVLSSDLTGNLLSAAFSYSNFLFYQTTNYFSDSYGNPLLHTWSLAVEEQFYLFFPLLLMLVSKLKISNSTIIIFAGLSVVSLLSSGIVVFGDQSQAFFFPWFRAWEFLAGAMLSTRPLEKLPKKMKFLSSAAGAAAIIVSCTFYTSQTVFPGFRAFLPVLGAVGIIAGSGTGHILNKVLGSRAAVWLGKISYSLYLAHWPIMCAIAGTFGLNSKTKIAAVLLSILAGWVSYLYVETPFRKLGARVSARQVFLSFSGAWALVVCFFFGAGALAENWWRGYPEAIRHSAYLREEETFFFKGPCFLESKRNDLKYFDFPKCLNVSASKGNILVLGDSHAANLASSLAEKYAGKNILQATASSCLPTLDTEGAPFCTGLINYIYGEWLPQNKGSLEAVVLAGRWNRKVLENIKKTIGYLNGLQIPVIFYGPTPEYSIRFPLVLVYEDITKLDLQAFLFNKYEFGLDSLFRASLGDKVKYFSPLETFCDGGRCSLVRDGKPMMLDDNHFTRLGAQAVVSDMKLFNEPTPKGKAH